MKTTKIFEIVAWLAWMFALAYLIHTIVTSSGKKKNEPPLPPAPQQFEVMNLA